MYDWLKSTNPLSAKVQVQVSIHYTYRKVASSRPVYYSIFDYFWGATNQDVLLLPCTAINQHKRLQSNSKVIYFSYQNVGFSRIPIRFFLIFMYENTFTWKKGFQSISFQKYGRHLFLLTKTCYYSNFWPFGPQKVKSWNLGDAKGALSLHLSTVYFSHLSHILDHLRKCIHISKPLTVIRSYCWWNKQLIILSFVKITFFNFF